MQVWAAIAILAILPWLLEISLFRKNFLLILWWVFLPLSLPLIVGNSKLQAPSELILLLWLTLPLLRGLPSNLLRILRHPVSILLMLDIAIHVFSTINSSMPEISVKRTLFHIFYILGGYFLMIPVFSSPKNILKMSSAMSIGLIPVIISVLYFLSKFYFNSEVAPEAPRPFFSDHTQFGSFAALLLPLSFISYRYRKRIGLSGSRLQILLLTVLVSCIIFSFSRAVWLSTAAMVILYFLIRFRMRFSHLLILLLICGGIVYNYSTDIYQSIQQNEAESNRQEVWQQLKSVGNVKTDVSNLERINRWKSAWKMFEERPVLGFGPGTYQFQYAPYQELQDKTVISSNFGEAGNAHSEYLMFLSETGIFGFLDFLAICLYLIYIGFRIIYTAEGETISYLGMALLLALCGFMVHSLFNSFLETDKIGLTFYFMMAALVALDIKSRLPRH